MATYNYGNYPANWKTYDQQIPEMKQFQFIAWLHSSVAFSRIEQSNHESATFTVVIKSANENRKNEQS